MNGEAGQPPDTSIEMTTGLLVGRDDGTEEGGAAPADADVAVRRETRLDLSRTELTDEEAAQLSSVLAQLDMGTDTDESTYQNSWLATLNLGLTSASAVTFLTWMIGSAMGLPPIPSASVAIYGLTGCATAVSAWPFLKPMCTHDADSSLHNSEINSGTFYINLALAAGEVFYESWQPS